MSQRLGQMSDAVISQYACGLEEVAPVVCVTASKRQLLGEMSLASLPDAEV